MTNNQPTTTLNASSRTHFFDVKTSQSGGKCLVITDGRHSEQQRSQITIFSEDARSFLAAVEQIIMAIAH